MTLAYARQYTLWGKGRKSGVSLSGVGGQCYIFSAGNRANAFVQLAFFLAGNRARNGVAIVVAFKNMFTLGTCSQIVFKYFMIIA